MTTHEKKRRTPRPAAGQVAAGVGLMAVAALLLASMLLPVNESFSSWSRLGADQIWRAALGSVLWWVPNWLHAMEQYHILRSLATLTLFALGLRQIFCGIEKQAPGETLGRPADCRQSREETGEEVSHGIT